MVMCISSRWMLCFSIGLDLWVLSQNRQIMTKCIKLEILYAYILYVICTCKKQQERRREKQGYFQYLPIIQEGQVVNNKMYLSQTQSSDEICSTKLEVIGIFMAGKSMRPERLFLHALNTDCVPVFLWSQS